MGDYLDKTKVYSFYIFFIIALIALFVYVYPRHEFDRQNADVALGFEKGYNAEITDFYSVRDINEVGLSGERVVFVMDFEAFSSAPAEIERALEKRQGAKIIFIGSPPDISPETFSGYLDGNNIDVGFLELNRVTSWMRQVLEKRSPLHKERMFRVHTIKPAEIDKIGLTYSMVLRRWLRAKQERSIDFFWIQPLDEAFIPYNEYGLDIARLVKPVDGIVTGVPDTNFLFRIALAVAVFCIIYFYSPLFFVIALFVFLFYLNRAGFNDSVLYLTGMGGAFGITGIFRTFRDVDYSPRLKYLSLLLLAFTLGITINALGFSFEAVNQILMPHGVKLTLLYLPLLVFLREFASYGAEDLKKKLHWTDLLVMIFIVLFMIYYLMRSGNSGWVLSIERQFRDQLEILFGIRPRFKELVGIPALWLYFNSQHRSFGRYSFLIPVLGTVGLVSIINAFQHYHTPIMIILYREGLGVVLGTVIGGFISFLMKRGKTSEN